MVGQWPNQGVDGEPDGWLKDGATLVGGFWIPFQILGWADGRGVGASAMKVARFVCLIGCVVLFGGALVGCRSQKAAPTRVKARAADESGYWTYLVGRLTDTQNEMSNRLEAGTLLMASKDGRALLQEHLDDQDGFVRMFAITSLSPEVPRELARLETYLDDPVPNVTVMVTKQLQGAKGMSSAAHAKLLSFLVAPTDLLRAYAVATLASLQRADDFAILAPLAEDPSPYVRVALYQSLGDYFGDRARPILERGRRDSNASVAQVASEALKALQSGKAHPPSGLGNLFK